MTVRAPRQPWWRRRFGALAAACATLAVVLLAPLAAGTGHGLPPTAVEWQRLAAAVGGDDGPVFAGSEVARQYFVAAAGREPPPADASLRAAFVGRARLLQLLAIAGIAGLVYFAVLLARGRLQALLTCAALAMLPPVAAEGAVLRPEAPATLFAGLALLLLQSFAQTAIRPVRGARWRRPLSLVGLGGCAALALGLAIAALPSLGAPVLLPGLVLTLGAAMLLVRALRVLRRRGLERLPYRALNARLLPWTALALLVPAVVIGVLAPAVTGSTGSAAGTTAAVGLLPQSWLVRSGCLGLLLAGGAAAVLRIGLRFGRGGRIGAEVVLLVYCALWLTAAAGAPPHVDQLPAAPALAIVLAAGARALFDLVRWGSTRRRRAP